MTNAIALGLMLGFEPEESRITDPPPRPAQALLTGVPAQRIRSLGCQAQAAG